MIGYSIAAVSGATSYVWSVSGGATISTGQGTNSVNIRYTTATLANAVVSVSSKTTCGTSIPRTLPVAVNLGCKLAPEAAENSLVSFSELLVFPNPARERSTVSFISYKDDNYTIKIIDVLGKIILSEKISAVEGYNKKEINLENASKGIYIISVQTDDGDIKTMRLLVE